jgi:hypothetical protein
MRVLTLVGPAKAAFIEVALIDVALDAPGLAEVGCADVRLTEVGLAEGPTKADPLEVGRTEARARALFRPGVGGAAVALVEAEPVATGSAAVEALALASARVGTQAGDSCRSAVDDVADRVARCWADRLIVVMRGAASAVAGTATMATPSRAAMVFRKTTGATM